MNSPFFSIIIPTFNSEKTIRQCLNSIVSQTFTDYEILLIDGLSTDSTIDIIKEFSLKFSNIDWVSEIDKGIYDAMNKGIGMAKGEWVYFLGSDDYLFDSKVLTDVHDYSKNDEADMIYGNISSPNYGHNYDGEFDSSKILKKNIGHQAIFYKKKLFKKHKYNLKYKMLADWDFNLSCFLNPKIIKVYIPRVISFFSPGGVSSEIEDVEFAKDFEGLIRKYKAPTLRLWLNTLLKKNKIRFHNKI